MAAPQMPPDCPTPPGSKGWGARKAVGVLSFHSTPFETGGDGFFGRRDADVTTFISEPSAATKRNAGTDHHDPLP
jgi:hypothetical protein